MNWQPFQWIECSIISREIKACHMAILPYSLPTNSPPPRRPRSHAGAWEPEFFPLQHRPSPLRLNIAFTVRVCRTSPPLPDRDTFPTFFEGPSLAIHTPPRTRPIPRPLPS